MREGRGEEVTLTSDAAGPQQWKRGSQLQY